MLSVVAAATPDYNQATLNVAVNVQAATPTITWSTPSDITYGTPLGPAQLDATASVPGTFTYTPAAGTALNAGQAQILSVTFTPTDTANYSSVTTTTTINVAPAPLTVTVNNATKVYGQPNPSFSANDSGFVDGDTASVLGGSLTLNTVATSISDVGSYDVTAGGLTAQNYAITYVKGTLSVTPANQTITWVNPANIIYGTALGAAQLDATASVVGPAPAGILSYTPATGTVMHAGFGQTLTVTAAATHDYNLATTTVTINVDKAIPTINWSNPADINYGTTLSSTQLNATASVPGTFVYTPAASTVLNAGRGQTLSATFTPTDTTDYSPIATTTTINVAPQSTLAPSPLPTPAPISSVTIQSIAPVAAPPVTVLGVRWQTHKVSRTRSVNVLVVSYSGTLNPSDAKDLAAYHLFRIGTGKKLGAHDEKAIILTSATYDPSARTVTLTPQGTVAGRGVQLSITAAQMLDSEGRPIDGNRDGQPGGDYVTNLDRGGTGAVSTPSRVSPARGRRPEIRRGDRLL
jgi:hypothetical protein